MKSKGLSQVLSVIVAASVLMMLGLTLTVMTQGSIDQLFTGSNAEACESSIDSKCRDVEDDEVIGMPVSCQGLDEEQRTAAIAGSDGSVGTEGNTIECN